MQGHRDLDLEVGPLFGGVDMNIQDVIEKACFEAELERIFHDIYDWTAVESNYAEHPNTILSSTATECTTRRRKSSGQSRSKADKVGVTRINKCDRTYQCKTSLSF